MNLIVCGRSEMGLYRGKYTHMILIADPEEAILPNFGVPAARTHAMFCHDIDSFTEVQMRQREFPGYRCRPPSRSMVAKALKFAERVGDHETLLITCEFGVSRSTALAFAVLCQSHPEEKVSVLWKELLKIRHVASPNELIVQHADDLLNRGGQIRRALRN